LIYGGVRSISDIRPFMHATTVTRACAVNNRTVSQFHKNTVKILLFIKAQKP